MNTLAFFGIVLVAQCVAILAQHLVPTIGPLFDARPLLYPVLLAYGALALPFGGMLALAFCSGLLWDALTAQFLVQRAAGGGPPQLVVENSLGWSILLYALLGALIHGLRPLFLRGRWDIHCLASGFCTVAILLTEYLLMTFRRGGLVFPSTLWPRIFLPGFFAMLAAPPVYFLFNYLANLLDYRVRNEAPS
ncbi:MAG: hypothetical protein JO117_03990 [Verrucomicrobia bacterium]|nr:hypothetical protein [Verrucomicrobiota bacterium]MBV9657004.1 hypothetical protein [Verrucomicrobiota bacterium]